MSEEDVVGNGIVVGLAVSGLASGLLVCAVMDPRLPHADSYTGIIFGVFLAVPLLLYELLDQYWKAAGLVVVTTLAYPISVIAAMWFQMGFPRVGVRGSLGTDDLPAPITLAVGGAIGGAIVFMAVAFFCRRARGQSRAGMVLRGALAGGVLGFTAWILRSSVGVVLWHIFNRLGMVPSWSGSSPREWIGGVDDYGRLARTYALYVTWQTGVATAIGFALRRVGNIRKESANLLSSHD